MLAQASHRATVAQKTGIAAFARKAAEATSVLKLLKSIYRP